MRSKFAGFLKNLLLSIISLIFFCALVEGFARLAYGPPQPTAGGVIAKQEGDGHFLMPNLDTMHAGKRVTTNSLGLRDRRAPHKSDGKTQIIVLGDSFTFGFGVDMEDSYPFQLEELLNAGARREFYEVINAGVPGYDTVNELRLLERIIPHYSPAWIIVGFHTGDLAEQHTPATQQHLLLSDDVRADQPREPGSSKQKERRRVSALVKLANKVQWSTLKLRDKSAFFSWLLKLYKTELIKYIPPPRKFTWKSEEFLDPSRFHATKTSFRRIKDIADEHGAEMIVFMIVPLVNWEAYPYRALHAALAEFCAGNGIYFVDPLEEFAKHRAGDLWVAVNDGHYSPEANRIAASVLCTSLLASNQKSGGQ
ncbi:MAG: hypothetical protein KAY24_04520 [Candidatus Eisenbacteria sp.]|nr:hypothetical protein [Candidatus Eisenbacteria bacterium]